MGLPEGVDLGMVAAVLVPIAIVTVLLRVVPFFVRSTLGSSSFIQMLGATMPVGVMVVLVVYTLSGLEGGDVVAGLIATALTLALHAWCRRSIVSIGLGTVAYMVLINAVF